jgi:hypothetical protein
MKATFVSILAVLALTASCAKNPLLGDAIDLAGIMTHLGALQSAANANSDSRSV